MLCALLVLAVFCQRRSRMMLLVQPLQWCLVSFFTVTCDVFLTEKLWRMFMPPGTTIYLVVKGHSGGIVHVEDGAR